MKDFRFASLCEGRVPVNSAPRQLGPRLSWSTRPRANMAASQLGTDMSPAQDNSALFKSAYQRRCGVTAKTNQETDSAWVPTDRVTRTIIIIGLTQSWAYEPGGWGLQPPP